MRVEKRENRRTMGDPCITGGVRGHGGEGRQVSEDHTCMELESVDLVRCFAATQITSTGLWPPS